MYAKSIIFFNYTSGIILILWERKFHTEMVQYCIKLFSWFYLLVTENTYWDFEFSIQRLFLFSFLIWSYHCMYVLVVLNKRFWTLMKFTSTCKSKYNKKSELCFDHSTINVTQSTMFQFQLECLFSSELHFPDVTYIKYLHFWCN